MAFYAVPAVTAVNYHISNMAVTKNTKFIKEVDSFVLS